MKSNSKFPNANAAISFSGSTHAIGMYRKCPSLSYLEICPVGASVEACTSVIGNLFTQFLLPPSCHSPVPMFARPLPTARVYQDGESN